MPQGFAALVPERTITDLAHNLGVRRDLVGFEVCRQGDRETGARQVVVADPEGDLPARACGRVASPDAPLLPDGRASREVGLATGGLPAPRSAARLPTRGAGRLYSRDLFDR